MNKCTGYLHHEYAGSLQEFGTLRELPLCGGWVLERPIPGFPYRDAMGCYPLFSCRDWSQLHLDLQALEDELVSLALVADPFGHYDENLLRQSFDVVIPFKKHYIIDLHRPLNEIISRNRRKYARRALKKLQIQVVEDPASFIEEWISLYGNLIKKHSISGISAFSRTAFAKQLSIPGTIVMSAEHRDVTVAGNIYFVQGDVVYAHLGAASQTGYDQGAFPALDFYSIEYFAEKAHWLHLGGGAGITNSGADGLSLYKSGWSTETRTAYFCGRIFDREKYAEIVKAKGIANTDYFPAYRKGEFL